MSKFDDPLFNISFVRVVEMHPCLWNSNLDEYSKRSYTENAWTQVAEATNNSAKNCRKRWRNIRGAFLRSLRYSTNGSGSNVNKKYYLSKHLQFLLPYAKTKGSYGNSEGIVESDNSDEESSSLQEDAITKEVKEESQSNQSSPITIKPDSPHFVSFEEDRDDSISGPNKQYFFKKQKVAETSSVASSSYADDTFTEYPKQKRDSNNENPNLLFLRSLLPDMMNMTPKQNRRFRQKVIALMDDILEDADINV